jgi:hypothetical protein
MFSEHGLCYMELYYPSKCSPTGTDSAIEDAVNTAVSCSWKPHSLWKVLTDHTQYITATLYSYAFSIA